MNAELFSPFGHLEPYERLLASAERVASRWLLSHFSGLNADAFDPDNLDPNKPPAPTRMPNLNDLAEYATSLRRLIFARTRFIRTVPHTPELAALRETNLAALKNLGAIQALTEYLLNTYLTQKLNNIAELEMKEFSKFTLILPRLAASRHGLVHAHLATLTPNKPKPPPGSAGILPAHLVDQRKSSKSNSPWERQSPDWHNSNLHSSPNPLPWINSTSSVPVSVGPCPSVSNELTRTPSPNVAQPPSAVHLADKPLPPAPLPSNPTPLPLEGEGRVRVTQFPTSTSTSAQGAPHTSLGQATNASAGPGPVGQEPKGHRPDTNSPGGRERGRTESRRDDKIRAPDVSPRVIDPTPTPNPEGMAQHSARQRPDTEYPYKETGASCPRPPNPRGRDAPPPLENGIACRAEGPERYRRAPIRAPVPRRSKI